MEPIRSIRQKYKGFSKVNKRIADYILKDPTRLLSLTANEIASNSETSPASVTRFSKQLGFDSWEELKLSIAAVQAAIIFITSLTALVAKQFLIMIVT